MTDQDATGTGLTTGSVPRRVPRRASRPAGPPVERAPEPDPVAPPPPPPTAAGGTSPATEFGEDRSTRAGRRRTRERVKQPKSARTDAEPRTAPTGPPPRSAPHDPTERRGRSDQAGRSDQPGRSDQAGRSDQPGRSDQENRADKRRRAENDRSDRLARTLQTHRKTQLPPDIAMRAREYAQPTAEDLALAEAEVVLVRRNYVPPAPLDDNRPGGNRGGRGRRRG